MDNNNPTPTDPTLAVPTQPNLGGVEGGVKSGGNKMMMWFLVGGVAVLVIAGIVVVYFMTANKPNNSASEVKSSVDVSDLKSDADLIKDEDLDTDFQQVDTDLQKL